MKKWIRFLFVIVCCILWYSTALAANEKHFLLEDNNKIPIVYSGKYNEEMNTAKVTIRNFDD